MTENIFTVLYFSKKGEITTTIDRNLVNKHKQQRVLFVPRVKASYIQERSSSSSMAVKSTQNILGAMSVFSHDFLTKHK